MYSLIRLTLQYNQYSFKKEKSIREIQFDVSMKCQKVFVVYSKCLVAIVEFGTLNRLVPPDKIEGQPVLKLRSPLDIRKERAF